MKTRFVILKDRPKVKIELSRDSVCAGDDFDGFHKKIIEIYSFVDTKILVSNIYTDYLPNINGNGHSWDCYLNDKIIATITKNEIIPKVSEVSFNENNKIYFKYHSSNY
jgi:hypothetical protein